MPSIKCQECGKELLKQQTGDSGGEACLCSQCGREVFVHTRIDTKVKCPTCGKKNKTQVAV